MKHQHFKKDAIAVSNVGTQQGYVFDSKDELLTWVRDIGRANVRDIVIRTSDYGGGTKRPKIYLACERSGKYRSRKKLKDGSKGLLRQTGTEKCECPFDLKITSTKETEVRSDIMVDFTSHFTAKQVFDSKDELLTWVRDIGRANGFVIVIRTSDYGGGTKRPKIYLACERSGKVLQKAGRSQMQQLLGELEKHKYIERYQCEEGSMTVTDLFWAHLVSSDLLRTFRRVLIMDCTYKTNRYRLPLLEIVGVTSTHMTFSVAIAYLQTKRVDDYAWALQTMRDLIDNSVLPEVIVTDRELALMNANDNTFSNARHLLCRWHINKNVLTKCKNLRQKKNGTSLTLHGTMWYCHRLKRNIMITLQHCIRISHIQVKASIEKSLTTMQHQFKPSQFRELQGNVSIYALKYVLAKSKRANSVGIDVATCRCVLRGTHGLSCAHEIADYMRQGRPIPVRSIHVEKLELTCIPELEMILKRFNESDIAMKLDM
ncbi:PKS-NRPS hybrid synthetase CHGG_01239-like [Camellia sinensis]|uniref:PKS-NRPS hybrid synthetase CHGG_01239-like n=1 Tax=Camellia sinensis TaxID=4442 RepID=UPI001036A865|nr:PKS-NRPS hybrid synthetase CHGG_01239-like [Camellia sinensis]